MVTRFQEISKEDGLLKVVEVSAGDLATTEVSQLLQKDQELGGDLSMYIKAFSRDIDQSKAVAVLAEDRVTMGASLSR
jgi:hypothetical protein